MEIIIIVVLCITGVALILAEIFLIPGITVAGVCGALFSFAGIYYAFAKIGAAGGILTVIFVLAATGFLFLILVKSKALDTISLKTNIDSKVSEQMPDIAVGDTGVSISRLNPMGKVRINNITIEAKTLGDYLDENTAIEVLKVLPNQVIIKQVNS